MSKCRLQRKDTLDALCWMYERFTRLLDVASCYQSITQVDVQMFQLYRDGLEDLLREKKKGKDDAAAPSLKITLAEHSPTGLVHVEGAEIASALTPAEVMKIFARGSAKRTTASTQMNVESSRSHLICSLTVRLKNKRTGNESVGKLTLVDLAGSEVRIGRATHTVDRFM